LPRKRAEFASAGAMFGQSGGMRNWAWRHLLSGSHQGPLMRPLLTVNKARTMPESTTSDGIVRKRLRHRYLQFASQVATPRRGQMPAQRVSQNGTALCTKMVQRLYQDGTPTAAIDRTGRIVRWGLAVATAHVGWIGRCSGRLIRREPCRIDTALMPAP